MCNYQTIVYNTNGYVIKCRACRHLQIAFGTTVATMNDTSFYCITETVAAEYAYRSSCPEPEMKSSTIPIYKHTMLCLNFFELEALHSMFIQARAVLETYAILENA